jgi:D-beta-D-heptose 7-phosphate kinase/D-beta-D-heptose 1-phosphate adenosyltransferase
MVDAVVIFEEDTPLELIKTVQPDVLVKGGDYTLDQIVGAKEVMAAGGRVVINPIVPGVSTTGLIKKIGEL